MTYIRKQPYSVKSFKTKDLYSLAKKGGKLTGIKLPDFTRVVRLLNEQYANKIVNGEIVTFPYKFGKYSVRKIANRKWISDKEFVNTSPVNWYETKKLWEVDEEARIEKRVIKYDNEYTYMVKKLHDSSDFNNRECVSFKPHYKIKDAIMNNINNNLIEYL